MKNHPHSDYGDALCYLLCGMAMGRDPSGPRPARLARAAFNPLRHNYPKRADVGVPITTRAW